MCSQPWELALALGLAEGSPHASLHLKGKRVGLERSRSQEGGVQVSSGLLMPRELDHKLRTGHLSESRNEDQWGGRPEQAGVFMHMYVYTRVHACIYVQCVCARVCTPGSPPHVEQQLLPRLLVLPLFSPRLWPLAFPCLHYLHEADSFHS